MSEFKLILIRIRDAYLGENFHNLQKLRGIWYLFLKFAKWN